MVAFVPMNINREESIETVLMHVDHAINYGDDLEPQVVATTLPVSLTHSPPHSAICQSDIDHCAQVSPFTMSLLQFLRAIFLLAAVAMATGVSAEPDDGGNSTATNSTRSLEEAATTEYHTAMLNAVNKERAARGLPKLCKNSKLQSAAQSHSNDMARRHYLGHTGSDGSTATSRIRAAGYHWTVAAENVAAGQATVSSVMKSWMSSSAHRANILSSEYKMFGCGYAYSSSSRYHYYWTQDFASGSGEAVTSRLSQSSAFTSSTPLKLGHSAFDNQRPRSSKLQGLHFHHDMQALPHRLVALVVVVVAVVLGSSTFSVHAALPTAIGTAVSEVVVTNAAITPKPVIGTAAAQTLTDATATRELKTYSSTGFQTLMLNAVNKQRNVNGLSKLCINKKLQTAG
ncbi:unnamed protein product [Phytophthora lilii]|uniref:Unnamed protein product n=1 Tax=Phytophthora lilii TaxID=2077276 RepID=A0A9W6WNT7_9STRA|nr:unnamed protein product [Phytophthora lilii]